MTEVSQVNRKVQVMSLSSTNYVESYSNNSLFTVWRTSIRARRFKKVLANAIETYYDYYYSTTVVFVLMKKKQFRMIRSVCCFAGNFDNIIFNESNTEALNSHQQ